MNTNGESILVYFRNAIGDAIMTLPTLRALYSHSKNVSIVCDSAYEFLFQEIDFKHVFHCDTSEIPISDQLAEYAFDTFVSLSTYHDEQLDAIIHKNNFEYSMGYGGPYDFEYADEHGKSNLFDVYFRCAQTLNPKLKIEDFAAPMEPNSPILLEKIRELNQPIVVIHTDTKADKEWSPEKFKELITLILDAYPELIVAIVGRPKLDYTSISPRVIHVQSDAFQVSWEFVAYSDYFIGIDSCFMHLSDLNNKPGIALFGNTNVSEWGYRFVKDSLVLQGENGVIDDISAEHVFKKFEHLVQNQLIGS